MLFQARANPLSRSRTELSLFRSAICGHSQPPHDPSVTKALWPRHVRRRFVSFVCVCVCGWTRQSTLCVIHAVSVTLTGAKHLFPLHQVWTGAFQSASVWAAQTGDSISGGWLCHACPAFCDSGCLCLSIFPYGHCGLHFLPEQISRKQQGSSLGKYVNSILQVNNLDL